MSGDLLPRRGEVWWVRLDKRRPAIVVQSDLVRDPRTRTFLVVPLTSRLHLDGLPGNLRLAAASTGLGRPSVANVYDLQKVYRTDFLERTGALGPAEQANLDAAMRLALGI